MRSAIQHLPGGAAVQIVRPEGWAVIELTVPQLLSLIDQAQTARAMLALPAATIGELIARYGVTSA